MAATAHGHRTFYAFAAGSRGCRSGTNTSRDADLLSRKANEKKGELLRLPLFRDTSWEKLAYHWYLQFKFASTQSPPMPTRQPPLAILPELHIPKLCAAWLRVLRKFDASYHNMLPPTLMRGAIKYHKSHSRSMTRSRWYWPPLMLAQSAAVVQDISTRSKCVPIRIEFVVVADPVKKPFGLHRNRSWPIRKL